MDVNKKNIDRIGDRSAKGKYLRNLYQIQPRYIPEESTMISRIPQITSYQT